MIKLNSPKESKSFKKDLCKGQILTLFSLRTGRTVFPATLIERVQYCYHMNMPGFYQDFDDLVKRGYVTSGRNGYKITKKGHKRLELEFENLLEEVYN